MSQDSNYEMRTGQKRPSRVWRIAKIIGFGLPVVVVALILIQVALDPPHENELGLRSGLKINAAPGVDVYIGNKHVGTGLVELTWDELLGTSSVHPLATLITNDVPLPSPEGLGAVTAEALRYLLRWKDVSGVVGKPTITESSLCVSRHLLAKHARIERTKCGWRLKLTTTLTETKCRRRQRGCLKRNLA